MDNQRDTLTMNLRHRLQMPMARRFLLAVLLLSTPSALPAQPAPSADTGRATVLGIAHDSVTREPLVGAVVQLASYPEIGKRSFTAIADSVGAFRFDSVPGGRYLIGFFHPTVDALQLEPPLRIIDVPPEGPLRVDVAIPSPRSVIRTVCGEPAPGDSSGLLVGRVRDADTGSGMPGSIVVIIWSELVLGARGLQMNRRQFPITADENGSYAACSVPGDVELVARAEHGADSSGFIEVRVPPGGVRVRDFAIGRRDTTIVLALDSAQSGGDAPRIAVRRGSARLSGTVRNVGGRPLSGAQIELHGSGLQTRTDERGTFSLADLPTGTHSLEVRQIGYAPKRIAVDLQRREMTTVAVELERAQELAPVRVLGKAPARRSLSGFLERKERGFGRYVTRADIEKWHIFRTSDILRRMPGVQVTPSGAFGQAITMRGGCQPAVFIDGMQLPDAEEDLDRWVQPHEIAGVEVYTGVGIPPEFSRGSCGALVIWTGAAPR